MRRHVRLRRFVSSLCCVLVLLNGPILSTALADPSGGAVVAGAAAISQQPGALNVMQSTDRAVINWNGFSLSAGQVANFHLPSASSAVLNRVITPNNPSLIYGAINSNGNVFLINPSGVLVGPSGVINTNGFTASALDIPNAEFMRGGALNFRGSSKASVINQGTINTGTGGANLIGNQVINEGTITSQGGSINLAAGYSVQLQGGGTYTQAELGVIQNGINEYASVISNTGTIRAVGAAEIGGEVYLVNPGGTVLQQGLIEAQQKIAATPTTTAQSNGGVVKIDAGAGQTKIGGTIDVSGDRGGRVSITGQDVQLAGANINASGTNGGGQIQIGGGFQGRDLSIRNALTTSVDSESLIRADAIERGNGGQVVVWANGSTNYLASISARGGALSGNGGTVEVSGKNELTFAGAADTSAGV